MKILITGGAGFIGANFVYKSLALRYKVHLVEKKGTNFWRLKDIKNKVKINYIDLKNYRKLENLILKLKPEIILHFAAYGTCPKKHKELKEMIETNFIGTANLVNACSKVKFKCFINTGSSSEYGIKEKPMKETDILEPDNPYGITKAAGTMYCQYMAKNLDLPIVTMRPFSPYGYFEDKERLIPTVIESCLNNKKLKLSSPKSVRDYIFIDDVIEAYFSAIKNIRKIKGEIFNLGAGEQNTVAKIVRTIKEITKSKIKPEYGKLKIAQTEPKSWLADISKAKKMLDWRPKYNLQVGLKKTAEWQKLTIKKKNIKNKKI